MLRTSLFGLLTILVGACGGKTSAGASSEDAGIDTASPLVDSTTPVVDSTPKPIDTAVLDTSRPDVGPSFGAVPPPRPTTVAADGTTRWFAVQRFQLGITRKGTTITDPNAWKDFGFDLDQRVTTLDDSKTSNNSCKRQAGSPTSILADGTAGIDNNFGGHFMQVVKSLKSDAEDATNLGVTNGTYTLLIRLDNVGPGDNARVPGALYVGRNLGTTPTFTEKDVWPVTSDSLVDGATIAVSKFSFPNGYMSGGVWVNDDFGAASSDLPVPFFSGILTLPLQSSVVAFDTKGGSVGMIAGGVLTEAFKAAMTPGLKSFGLCPGNATYDQVVDTLTQSADLVGGAPRLQDTTKTCDAISIGIGFIPQPTGAPTSVASPLPPPPDGCR